MVAMTEGRVIGKNNRLPWHFPADLKNFKKLTMGGTVIMGRKTFESIGKPLPGRDNFVVSHKPGPEGERLKFFPSPEEALVNIQTQKAFIIGGQSLYEQTLDRIDGIYLTLIEGTYEGDAFYPLGSVEEMTKAGFKVVSRHRPQEERKLEFVELRRHPERSEGSGDPSALRVSG